MFKKLLFWFLRKDVAKLNEQLAEQVKEIEQLKLQQPEEKKKSSGWEKENENLQKRIIELGTENANLQKQIIPEADKDRHIINLNLAIKKTEKELEEQKQITQGKNDEINKLKGI